MNKGKPRDPPVKVTHSYGGQKQGDRDGVRMWAAMLAAAVAKAKK